MTDKENYNRHAWMTDDQWECMLLLERFFGGFHHMNVSKVKEYGRGIGYGHHSSHFSAATYDYDGLTRLVLLAHQRCIRIGFDPSGPGMLKLCLFKRKTNGTSMNERHPSLDDLIALCNQYKEVEG